MTLICLESFDNIATADLPAKGWAVNSSPEVSVTQARTGSNALYVNSNLDFLKRSIGSANESATLVMGAAFYASTFPSSDTTLFAFMSDAVARYHVSLCINGTGVLIVRRGSYIDTLLGTASGQIAVNTWNYIEMKATLSDTVGAVEVRVNGAIVLSLTGIDTKNAGTKTVFDGIFVGSYGNNINAYFDDLYACNAAGTINNDFLGDLRVRSLAPTANGASSQLVGSDGNSIDNYLLVDDPTPDTADYVGSATLDQKDTYAFGDLPDASGTIVGVQVNAHATKTDTGARNLALVTRSGAVDYDSPDVALGFGSNAFVQQLRELDPATAAAWTLAAVNAAEFGAKVR